MSKIETTGQLRQFLADCLVSVKDGKIKQDEARNITKMAAQINESIYSEIKTARVMFELGRESQAMGQMSVGNPVK